MSYPIYLSNIYYLSISCMYPSIISILLFIIYLSITSISISPSIISIINLCIICGSIIYLLSIYSIFIDLSIICLPLCLYINHLSIIYLPLSLLFIIYLSVHPFTYHLSVLSMYVWCIYHLSLPTVRTQRVGHYLQAKQSVLRRNWPCQHLDLRCPTSRPWEINVRCWSPCRWDFVASAWADRDTPQSFKPRSSTMEAVLLIHHV